MELKVGDRFYFPKQQDGTFEDYWGRASVIERVDKNYYYFRMSFTETIMACSKYRLGTEENEKTMTRNEALKQAIDGEKFFHPDWPGILKGGATDEYIAFGKTKFMFYTGGQGYTITSSLEAEDGYQLWQEPAKFKIGEFVILPAESYGKIIKVKRDQTTNNWYYIGKTPKGKWTVSEKDLQKVEEV